MMSSAINLSALQESEFRVVSLKGKENDADCIVVERLWNRNICKTIVKNTSEKPIKIKEIVLVSISLALPLDTKIYGEGFQFGSQTGGTLGKPVDICGLTDHGHYRMPIREDFIATYGLLTFSPSEKEHLAFAFTSCRRFIGKFYIRPDLLEIACDTEGLTLQPGESWEMEELSFFRDLEKPDLMRKVADGVSLNHPRLEFPSPPTGWCSWYYYGPKFTAENVSSNLEFIRERIPKLKYIQIDDGYQPKMGDWLDTDTSFGGNVQSIINKIRERGFDPAIWVAPFIAEKSSNIFQKHPDWFIKDSEGNPLDSSTVTFGGWRRKPWYVLDGTHPEVQRHFRMLFSTMREEWNVSYFKLDALFWGAIHGGYFWNKSATRIEAYRLGMQSIIDGAGKSFILGCNHPIWPSLGLLHGSRSSCDISRSWKEIVGVGTQNLYRSWQNGKLWWNDPDAIVLGPGAGPGEHAEPSLNECRYHATTIYACGGMLLSGDELSMLSAEKLEMLKKLLSATHVAAEFQDESFRLGVIKETNRTIYCLLNSTENVEEVSVEFNGSYQVEELWTGENLGRVSGNVRWKIEPQSGSVRICTPVN